MRTGCLIILFALLVILFGPVGIIIAIILGILALIFSPQKKKK